MAMAMATAMTRGAVLLHALGVAAVLALASNPQPPHVLLLLDASASMASQNRFEKINVAVRGWIENFIPEGIKLSLWKFASDAVEIKSVVIDSTFVSRQDIMNSIPQVETKSSCISCAIETVLKQVTKNVTILLMTDGEDKFLEQDLKDLNEKIVTSQSKVIAVLIGNSLNNIHLLEELTGGSVNHVADTNSVLGLLDTLQAAILTVKNFTGPINIHEEEFSSSKNNFNSTFVIDSTVVQNTCINLYYWPIDMPLSVELLTPKGDSQKISSKQFKSGNLKYCRLPEMVGKWEVKMSSSTFNKFLALQITATKNETEIKSDITLNCWIEMGENYLSLCGSIHPGEYFINTTKMSVDIIAHDGEVTEQELLQIFGENNEKGLKENLFVRKHLNIRDPGYYSARCRAEGQVWEDTDAVLEPQQFTRVSWAGTFQTDKSHNGLLLPSEIKDLFAFVESQPGKCIITMEFSAPIKAVKYKLILSSSLYDVLSDEGLILATVPGIAGTKESINFKVPSWLLSPPVPLYVAMSAVGENGVEGEVSNVVLVMCHKHQTETSPPLQLVPKVTTYPSHEDHSTKSFTTQSSISSTTVSPEGITNNSTLSLLHSNSSFSSTSPSYEKEISQATEVNDYTTLSGFISNSSGVIPNNISNTSVTTEENNHDNRKQPFNIIGAIGILIAVLLIIVAAILTYHTLYNRRRCKSYEVASRQSTSQDPFNETDEL